MPFSRPTLRTLIDRIVADINARLPEGDARLAGSVLNVLAYVQGGAANGLYGYLDWLARQVLPDTADAEILDRWASIWGVTRTAAAPAAGNVAFTGTTGATVPTGTLLQRADGQQFRTTADVILAAGAGATGAVAVTGGAAGNTAAGVSLNLVSPIAGIGSTVTVAAPMPRPTSRCVRGCWPGSRRRRTVDRRRTTSAGRLRLPASRARGSIRTSAAPAR